MLIKLKVKTLDARTHEFSIDNELTIRQFKDQIAEKTNIAAENQRIIYQGRVLADEKQVKEYDVDGKVLHVAERPPFSQRGANSRNNDEPMRPFRNVARPPQPGMRTSPYFRALDGMLVRTMAIPVNNGPVAGTRTPPSRYPNSSSFCINRITVALHMIDCADNIAAYLENPAVGLNNQSLDILQRGRWSMESTVVEVGVSSTDLPRNNNIIDMVQDAVTAALSRTGARNYTVVQLPTVYTNENGETSQQRTGESTEGEGVATGTASDASGETTAATVIIEDVIETDDEAADGASDRSATPTPEAEAEGAVGGQPASAAENPSSSNGAASDAAAGGEGANNTGPRRRTRPQVLAQVIQHYRGVQTRLAPFVDRYYEILQNDPTFEDNDTAGREDAQRIFDRVSEAFHYLSHAQHAISDLMLDLSQPGPRVLTCRPILVEQSGYIRSNNILTPNFLAPPPTVLNEPFRTRGSPAAAAATATQTPNAAVTPIGPPQAANLQAAIDASRSAAAMAEIASRAAGAAAEIAAAEIAAGAASAAVAAARGLASDHVEDPIDEPMVAPNATGTGPFTQEQQALEMDHDHDQTENESPERETRAAPRLRVYVPVTLPPPNPQSDVARILQAMFSRQRGNVEINAPNIMSINLPVHVMTAVRQAPEAGAPAPAEPSAPAAETSQEGASTASDGDSPTAPSTSAGTRGADQRTNNTLPTTATQTRSTSRPQIQIGGNNNWGGRIAPTHTAFDRFLPCNSHHIREPEPLPHNNNVSSANNNRSTNAASAAGSAGVSPTAASGTRPVTSGRIQRGSASVRPMWSWRRLRPASEQMSSLRPAAWAQSQSQSQTQTQTHTTSGQTAHVGGGSTNGAGVGAGAGRVRPTGGSHISRDRLAARTALVGGGATNGGLTSVRRGRLQAATGRLSRQFPTQLVNFLLNNLRNNAQTAPAGSGVAAEGGSAAPSSGAEATPSSAAEAPVTVASTAHAAAAPPQAAAAATPASGGDSSNLRLQLRSFLNDRLFDGAAINDQTIPAAFDRAVEWFNESLVYLPQYEKPMFNSRASVCNILRFSLGSFIRLFHENSEETDSARFELELKRISDRFRHLLFNGLFLCLGPDNAELFWQQLMRLLREPLRSNFRNEALEFLSIFIDPTVPEDHIRHFTSDALQFLVRRDVPYVAPPPLAILMYLQPTQQQSQQQPEQQTVNTDVEMAEVATSSSNSSPVEQLPAVIVGSEPWHMSFPNDWLPVITRDLQTQTEASRPQPPFSDAYISGMSAKRRKIIQSEKPTATVECLIANGVQRAIQGAGLGGTSGSASSSSISTDAVIGSIAHDAAIQASYTDAVRSGLKERIKQDADFKASKYPQIAKFAEQK
ncbi:large proline-rich protein bag6-A isoform X2 [Drosophila ficusphila]|uniref:large proline-rich protein bag6-A isoform X2 n=1 Tax=Drosophila ficusphila TaxID=30025 RepID=UPI0007E7AB5A|nr:large proline-rich protein bag6-A isoform X2 [Drosophila ficusphila]